MKGLALLVLLVTLALIASACTFAVQTPPSENLFDTNDTPESVPEVPNETVEQVPDPIPEDPEPTEPADNPPDTVPEVGSPDPVEVPDEASDEPVDDPVEVPEEDPEEPIDEPVEEPEPMGLSGPISLDLEVAEWTPVPIVVSGDGDFLVRSHVEELTIREPIADSPVVLSGGPAFFDSDYGETEDGDEFTIAPQVHVPEIEETSSGFVFDGPLELRLVIDGEADSFDTWRGFGDQEVVLAGPRDAFTVLRDASMVTLEKGIVQTIDGVDLEVIEYVEEREGDLGLAWIADAYQAFTQTSEGETDQVPIDGVDFTFELVAVNESADEAVMFVFDSDNVSENTTLTFVVGESEEIDLSGVVFELELRSMVRRITDEYAVLSVDGDEYEVRETDLIEAGGVFYVDDVFHTTIPVETVSVRVLRAIDTVRLDSSGLERFDGTGWNPVDVSYEDEGDALVFSYDVSELEASEFVTDPLLGLFSFGVETGFGDPEFVFEDRSIERTSDPLELELRARGPGSATLLTEATDGTLVLQQRTELTAE